MTTLLAVPNVSEGRDQAAIRSIADAFDSELLDVHSDPDHNRTVFTLAGEPGRLADALIGGARETLKRIDLSRHEGVHPRVGALDVAPIVYLTEDDRGAAIAEALVLADRLGEELSIPVFLYGSLAAGRTRAELRRELDRYVPDFGPTEIEPNVGATLVAARPPLVAFNLELKPPASEQDAKRIAAAVRSELEGVRALGLWLESQNVAQVSTNVEDHRATPLRDLVTAVARHAPIARTELVGLAPAAAFERFPEDVEVANRRLIEDLLP